MNEKTIKEIIDQTIPHLEKAFEAIRYHAKTIIESDSLARIEHEKDMLRIKVDYVDSLCKALCKFKLGEKQ